MREKFSRHALLQIEERNLTGAEVLRTVRSPQKVIHQTLDRYRAVQAVRKRGKRYLLVVIYDEIGSKRVVVTAFLTTKFKKYL